MSENKLSHRRIRSHHLVSAVLRARDERLIEDVERLAAVAGIELMTVALAAVPPPAILTLVEVAGRDRLLTASFNPAVQPEFGGQEVSVDPRAQPGDLLELFVAAGATQRGPVVGVIGAHGGAGASTAAALIARQSVAGEGAVALVDLDPQGGGQDVLLGLESDSGKRWADIGSERGALLPGRLLAALPLWRKVRVLTGDDRGSAPSQGRKGVSVLGALSQVCALTVTDLPRHALARHGGEPHEWLTWCDRLLMVTQSHFWALARARRALELVPSHVPCDVVIAGSRTVSEAMAAGQQLGRETVFPLRFERSFDEGVAHGLSPGDRSRSGSVRDVRRIVTAIAEAS